MTDETNEPPPELQPELQPEPGWSNTADTRGEPPPEIEAQASPMDTPGWSNQPPGATTPPPVERATAVPPPGWSNAGAAPTGATAGTPGIYTPAGAQAPLSVAALTGVTAVPATAWTTGQYRSEEHTSELQSLRHL